MELRVLGPIEAHDGRKLAIGGPRQRRILAALAMQVGEVVSLDRLADIAWPGDEAPENAEHNVRSYINRIRTGLGDASDRLVTAPPGYLLDLKPSELDASQLTILSSEADRAFEHGQLDAAVERCDRALELWRGQPYAEFADEEWVRAETARLDEIRLHVIERRCEALIDLGRTEEALAFLETLVAEQPYREKPRRLRMLALYHSGRGPEALRSFQEFRSLLGEELGADPSTDLVELDRRIAEHAPSLHHPEAPNRRLRGYELHEVIGEGAFAMVWRGTQPVLGRDVAIKQVRQELADAPDFIRRFEIEARIVSSLEHPYIVPLYDYWREPGAAYLVMRMLPGGTLETRLGDGPLTELELRRLVDQIGSALDTAHRRGVIHRDIKPGNILLDDEGNYFLTDFGIAFGTGDDSDDEAAAALSTGSPAYASPEQLRREPLDARTDIYAFGVTLFEAAAGEAPFGDERTRAGLVRRQLEDPLPAPSSIHPNIPGWIDTVVGQATTKRREDRYGSARQLVIDVETATETATADDGRAASSATLLSGQLRNPFKGLRAFTEADAGDFRGRQRLVARLVRALQEPGSQGRLVAAVGPSGSGKSSVVRAGLIPELRGGGLNGSSEWFFTTMVPGTHPFEELESALVRVASTPPGPLCELMSSSDRGIARAVKQVIPDDNAELLLVIDQFEELFTLVDGEEDRRQFIDGLIGAIKEPRSRLRVVLTVRADFWDRPLRYPNLAAVLETAAVTVTPLSADELERVIVDPVEEQGVSFEPGLVARISAEVADQPGALPLLQYTLTQLFDRQVAGVITSAAFDEMGGVSGSVAQQAEEVFEGLSADQQEAGRRLFGRLVTLGEGTEDTRRRVTTTELSNDAATAQALEEYGQARLLAFDRDPATSEPTVEVAHEALIREWPRLRAWLDDDRQGLRVHRHLTLSATAWDQRGRDDGDLYRGVRLDGADTWASTDDGAMNSLEREFLAASLDRRNAEQLAERRRLRRLRSLLAATAVIAVVAVVAGAFAVRAQRRADDVAFDAETSRLAATARELSTTDPRTGALIALASYQREQTPETLGALQTVLVNAGPMISWMGVGQSYVDVELLDGGLAAGVRSDGVDLFDRESGQLLDSVAVGASARVEREFWQKLRSASDGSTLAIAAGPTVMAFNTSGGALEEALTVSMPDEVQSVSVAGDQVAATSTEGAVRAWTMTGALVLEIDIEVPNAAEQYPLEEERPLWPNRSFWETYPTALSIVDHMGDRLTLMNNSELTVADVATQSITTRSYLYVPVGPQGTPGGVPEAVPGPDGSTALIGPVMIGTVGRVDELGDTTELTLLPDTLGAGLPSIMKGFVVDGQIVAVLGDGVVAWYDTTTGERTRTLDLGLGSALSAERDEDTDVVIVATARGLASFGLGGSGAIRDGLSRLPEQSSLTVSDSGRFVAAGASGDLAQAALFESVEGSWVPVDLGLQVGVNNSIERGADALLNTWTGFDENRVFQLEGVDEPTLLQRVAPDIGGSAGGKIPDEPVVTFASGAEFVNFSFETGEIVSTFPNAFPGLEVSRVIYHPSGDRMLVTTATGVATMYDPAVGLPMPDDPAAGLDIAIASWSEDGSLLATSSSTGTITIRDETTLEPIRTLLGTAGISNSWNDGTLLFSPDNSLLLTNFDGPPRLWDVEAGIQIGVPFPTARATNSGISVGDGFHVVTASDESILFWDLDSDGWVEAACRLAGAELTDDEWQQWGPRDQPRREICPG